jgi:hypothetical protein
MKKIASNKKIKHCRQHPVFNSLILCSIVMNMEAALILNKNQGKSNPAIIQAPLIKFIGNKQNHQILRSVELVA